MCTGTLLNPFFSNWQDAAAKSQNRVHKSQYLLAPNIPQTVERTYAQLSTACACVCATTWLLSYFLLLVAHHIRNSAKNKNATCVSPGSRPLVCARTHTPFIHTHASLACISNPKTRKEKREKQRILIKCGPKIPHGCQGKHSALRSDWPAVSHSNQ